MRALRVTLIVLVVIAGLFVAADRIAVHLAESEAADKIKSKEDLSRTPKVSIKGFPFLTQMLGSDLDRVDINLDGLTTETEGAPLRVTELNARLHHVRLGSGFSSATAENASGQARISYEDLSAAAGNGITVGYAGKDDAGHSRVKITGGLLGLRLSVTSTVTVVHGDTVRLHADSIPGSDIPRWEEKVREKTDFERKIDMPTGLTLADLTAAEDGIHISVTGTDVELS